MAINPNIDKYGFDYKGTIPLDLKLFPEVNWTDSSGREWTSNIKTRLEKLSIFTKNPDDSTKWVLYPTMMGGKDLDSVQQQKMILNNGHFGVYDTYDEGMKKDTSVHKVLGNKKSIVSKLINWFKDM